MRTLRPGPWLLLLVGAALSCTGDADEATVGAELGADVADEPPEPLAAGACSTEDRTALTQELNLPCTHCTDTTCRVDCVREHTGIGADCAGCVVEQVRCIGMQCSCGGSQPFSEAKCKACIRKSGCREAFSECSGIPFAPIGPEPPWTCSELLDCTKPCQSDYLTCADGCASQGLPLQEPLQHFSALSQCIAGQCAEPGDSACFGTALLGHCGSDSKVCVGGPGCTRQCEGKACGPDGCGATCGSCGPGKLCTAFGQCEEPAVACNDIGKTGQCEGEVLLVCETEGALQVTDCARIGKVCAFDDGVGRYGCLDAAR